MPVLDSIVTYKGLNERAEERFRFCDQCPECNMCMNHNERGYHRTSCSIYANSR